MPDRSHEFVLQWDHTYRWPRYPLWEIRRVDAAEYRRLTGLSKPTRDHWYAEHAEAPQNIVTPFQKNAPAPLSDTLAVGRSVQGDYQELSPHLTDVIERIEQAWDAQRAAVVQR